MLNSGDLVQTSPVGLARRIAILSVIANALLSAATIIIGLLAQSASVVAAGLEFAADVVTASLVYMGLLIASRPADQNHPYGHGRAEIVTGLIVGVFLVLAGISISFQSLRHYTLEHPPPASFGAWPLVVAIFAKSALMGIKLHYGRKIRSAALTADGWNDAVDILSAGAALTALGLTFYDPERFLAADHFGGFAVGLLVASIGLRVARDASLELMDTMPPAELMDSIRASAHRVEGVEGVEKCWARKTGLGYHVDLHLEVDPLISVSQSHGIAERVRQQIRRDVPAVGDVLVHVEPAAGGELQRPSP
jgi:cation diffusion facilitator family transporter